MIQRSIPFCVFLFTVLLTLPVFAQESGASSSADAPAAANSNTAAAPDSTTQAAAAVASGHAEPTPPDFIGHLVDGILEVFNVRTSGNTVVHYSIAALLLVLALLARRIVVHVVFPLLAKLVSRTRTTIDDKLFAALEGPVAAFIMLLGMFSALKVLRLSLAADTAISYGSSVAFSLVVFWGLWRALGAVLAHATQIAVERKSPMATFMPWIRKSVMTVFVVLAVLLTIQSLGYDVKAILAGLGIGGLAFALAAQDTLSNVFGAIVVAVDQPFKHGEVVNIQGKVGFIEDIGVRSTRIRLIDGSLLVMPNKIVAGETITNLSRFIKRRFELVLPLPYDTKPEQVQELVDEIGGFIRAQPEVNGAGVLCFFRGFTPNHLEIWSVYECPSPDFVKAMGAVQRINLFVMRALAARGIAAPAPLQRVQLDKQPPAAITQPASS
jgi:Small-conductance mechanosensitive channel